MKCSLIAAAVCLLAITGSQARADIVIDFTSANNPMTNVKSFSPGTSATTQLGFLGNTGTQVSVMSDLAMVSQGETTLNPASGSALMSSAGSLMISFPNILGIRDFSQKLDFTGNGKNSSENQGLVDVNVLVNFTDSNGNNPSSFSTMLDFENAPADRYDVTATNSEIITKISLSWINGAEVTSSKQIRINAGTIAAVPEPSSFACVGLVGLFGFVVPRGIRRLRNRK